MSGRWMTAGSRFAEYRCSGGDGEVSDFLTRTVLRELCRVCHDCGVVQIGVPRLSGNIGAKERSVRYALERLLADEWVTRAVRGTGNRHGTANRESVWVLHQLPDKHGELWPDTDWLRDSWQAYKLTKRYLKLGRQTREAVDNAYSGAVDNFLLAARTPSTSGTPVPPKYKYSRQQKASHPHAAARRRKQLRVVGDAT